MLASLVAACASVPPAAPPTPTLGATAPATPTPSGPRAVVETAAGQTTFRVEVADTDELRGRGLMGRDSLPADAGMVFVWTEDHRTPFHMRQTRIPLAIAFFDGAGRIVRILEMLPCPGDPCPVYDPGATYRNALEVNAGALGRAGAREGDLIRLIR